METSDKTRMLTRAHNHQSATWDPKAVGSGLEELTESAALMHCCFSAAENPQQLQSPNSLPVAPRTTLQHTTALSHVKTVLEG